MSLLSEPRTGRYPGLSVSAPGGEEVRVVVWVRRTSLGVSAYLLNTSHAFPGGASSALLGRYSTCFDNRPLKRRVPVASREHEYWMSYGSLKIRNVNTH
jgi:hypothetical protein